MLNNEREIKVGDEVRFGLSFMVVDEIDGNTFWCIDEDGQDHGLTREQIDIF